MSNERQRAVEQLTADHARFVLRLLPNYQLIHYEIESVAN